MPTTQQALTVANWLRERGVGALHCDSRRVQAGDAFVAWPGAATDGRRFVASALAAGALAALVEREGVETYAFDDERVLAVPGLKAAAGAIASAFHGTPSASLDMVAITGTNGKTSTAWWTAQLLSACAKPCALIGTLGMGCPPAQGSHTATLVPTGLTTPDPVMLQTELRRFVDAGLKACAIEASSIGLVEGRLNATRVRVAVFTNFTQDHLDFHGSMDAYWTAKAALFDWPGLAGAVINLDDVRGVGLAASLAARPGMNLWTVAVEPDEGERPPRMAKARLFAQGLTITPSGMAFEVGERNAQGQVMALHALSLPLVGQYNVSNLLCVLASARALGVPLAEAVQACAALTPVPGRMEQVAVASPDQPLVLVDYAHTPDALDKALQALQPLAARRGGALWVVVGCGGDRDAGKRPLMAAVAQRQAQRVVLTSDNPRSEDPQAILRQMVAGLSAPDAAQVEPDRALAIALATLRADAADVVLIAGKGHEDYQDSMGVKTPFSDVLHARAALAQRQGQGVHA
ncbi:MAG: UDP-N-acetylmuramoyl-L-alanyl-D-glutamate--2,6-diaminopimelate ligase [Hydrogenophaga sp.]|jgi:UDP-N-acetylmuramoyl-L-alanyl-D-glutamate--2,6-diaminopimelate ligase|uniref:UDP-N-acetylmuramoyl-L-alanyl-D-glutamate--2, 6-diaminopimelate ligase n=1 Tax=Hydrogenophaga sp. TaxID=1904254 RepID=UPI001D767215|nr:UDP-N-acetylmuramoyl-L-alanyl-D-glutamate--2,6-diaminopimelate ligase [Hydrogenophaga sp.]MBW0170577.1 UDP-N-acetylmuramoyl-L-alanyl-D-glutamate--2,6-diaminopimelate ligase [Hydrogenophaga sp.]MBW0185404.1 UDP-N-acetylmuramoyl-L-alanyl-D-glutamate--2,6-diaminopimelate ligase [Hydrogenophaga sp.]